MLSTHTNSIIPFLLIHFIMSPQNSVVFGTNYSVYTVNEFRGVLNIVNPGDQILLFNAYPGNFVASRNGTPENPIVLHADTNRVMLTASRADEPAIQFNGNHWRVHGFSVYGKEPYDSPAVTLSGQDIVLDEMAFVSGKVHILNTSAITIENSLFRVKNGYGVHLETSSEKITEDQGYRFINNTFVCENEPLCSTAIKVDSNKGQGPSSIENNTFRTSWYNWISTTANEVLIRNNTGSWAGGDGFSVYFSDEGGDLPISKTNVIFELNHCEFASNFCINVEPILHNSTCVKADNTFDNAIALTNMEQLCS